jgi:S1-C subfamily serine protease
MLSAKDSLPTGFDQTSYVAKPGERVDMGTIKTVPARSGEPGPLGILLEVRGGSLAVTSVQTNGPAANAGIEVGDTIASIDGQAVTDLGLDVAKRRLAPGVVADGQIVALGLARGPTIKITATRWQ